MGWGAATVEVRRLGLSRVGENTLLTIVLDRAAEPRITAAKTSGKPQLVVEFPQARAGRLPTRLEGDDILVEQVETQSAAGGVRITLDLFPDQPYSFWRQSRPGIGGQTLFILGLKPDTSGRGLAQLRPPAEPAPTPAAPRALHYLRGSRSMKRPRLRRSRPWRSTSKRRPPGTWFPAALPICAS